MVGGFHPRLLSAAAAAAAAPGGVGVRSIMTASLLSSMAGGFVMATWLGLGWRFDATVRHQGTAAMGCE